MYNPYAPQYIPRQRPVHTGPTVTYKDAMDTLAAMFPDMDRNIIDTLLKNNRGHMERTTEHLLAMGAGGDGGGAAAGVSSGASSSGATNGGASEADSNRQRVVTFSDELDIKTIDAHPNENQRPSAGGVAGGPPPDASNDLYSASAFSLSGRLPNNFLRPPAFYKAPTTRQMMLDRDLAAYLQDREYVDRLRHDPRLYRRQHAQDRAAAAAAGANSSSSGSQPQQKSSDDFSAKLDKFFDFFKPNRRPQTGPEYEPLTNNDGRPSGNDVELQTFKSSS